MWSCVHLCWEVITECSQAVTRAKEALNLLFPWLVPIDDCGFLSTLKPRTGGFVPLIGCKNPSTV